ncbi:ECF RNA polymerase sigma-E factor [compost metagenome]
MNFPGAIADLTFPVFIGSREDFDGVFKAYHQPLRYFASKYISKADAEDLVGNLFMKLWNVNKVFENKVHLQSFLYRAVHNACLDYLRGVKNTIDIEAASNIDAFKEVEVYLNEMMQAEVLAEIYRGIAGLPSQCAKVMTLSYIDGLSNKEIAVALGLSEQTVKNHKQRGLKVLKDKLSGTALLSLLFMIN